MAAGAINQGVYDAAEVARYLACPPERVVAWANPTEDGLPPIVEPSLGWAFNFLDLIGLRVALLIHDDGVPTRGLRRAAAALAGAFNTTHPFAEEAVLNRLAISGASLIAEIDGEQFDLAHDKQHGVFRDVVAIYLKRLEFNSAGLPTRWSPFDGVVMDPRIQAGAPCIDGTRILTAAVADLAVGESLEEIVDDFDLELFQIQAALEFESSLESPARAALQI